MSEFADNHVTNLGSALLARVLAGEGGLTFTRIVMGNGNMPTGQTPATMTDVVSPKTEMSITKAAVGESQTAVIGGRFDNTEVDETFEWRELGIYAKVGEDASDVLYSYGYTSEGELIPAGSGATVVEKLVDLVTYIGDVDTLTAVFDPDFIPQVERISEDVIASIEDQPSVDPATGKSGQYLDRPGLSKLWSDINEAISGAGQTLTADEVTITLAGGSVITLKDGGVTTAKIADASVTKEKLAPGAVDETVIGGGSVTVEKLADGSVTTAKLADGSVTTAKLGGSLVVPIAKGGTGATTASQARTNLAAAASSHTHAAGDIASGALPIERGGTGATTLDGARTVLFNFPDNDELLAYLGLS